MRGLVVVLTSILVGNVGELAGLTTDPGCEWKFWADFAVGLELTIIHGQHGQQHLCCVPVIVPVISTIQSRAGSNGFPSSTSFELNCSRHVQLNLPDSTSSPPSSLDLRPRNLDDSFFKFLRSKPKCLCPLFSEPGLLELWQQAVIWPVRAKGTSQMAHPNCPKFERPISVDTILRTVVSSRPPLLAMPTTSLTRSLPPSHSPSHRAPRKPCFTPPG